MRLPFAALLLTAISTPALAQVHYYGDLAIAPAGDRIATVEAMDSAAKVVIRSVADGHILGTVDPCDDCRYSDLTFGPDGTIAFLARGDEGVMLETAKGNRVRTVATIDGIASTPRFSPDGKRIALMVTLGAQKEAGARQAGVRQVGEIGEHFDERRLAIFDVGASVAPDAIKPLSPANRYIYEYDWAPDGRSLVVTSAIGNGDENWWVATLDAVDATTGKVRQITKPTTQLDMPRVSPDGKTVAYIGGLMSDFGSVGGDIYTVPFSGGTPKNLTQGSDTTNVSLDWGRGGMRTTALKSDTLQIGAIDATGKAMAPYWGRPASFSAGDGKAVFSRDGRTVATVVQDFTHAPAIYAGPVTAPKQITHDNDDVRPIVEARSIKMDQ
ncbi:TolB family protein [Stakelama saccharophila]|uniref:WD40-like Beta Propeller Repeat n=1 Tax=Stakelama saccharophila TaxID=3075605 RepID=A0ABZ0B8L5_9SPHN|nr:hypothetical protein [Stakelama sp. W311]WNO53644.1 hypothetical protein RPR59_14600 [Stakelama sp. W311]